MITYTLSLFSCYEELNFSIIAYSQSKKKLKKGANLELYLECESLSKGKRIGKHW
jgi:hypothetical protein